VEGDLVGPFEGEEVGDALGFVEGRCVVGALEGDNEGERVGDFVSQVPIPSHTSALHPGGSYPGATPLQDMRMHSYTMP